MTRLLRRWWRRRRRAWRWRRGRRRCRARPDRIGRERVWDGAGAPCRARHRLATRRLRDHLWCCQARGVLRLVHLPEKGRLPGLEFGRDRVEVVRRQRQLVTKVLGWVRVGWDAYLKAHIGRDGGRSIRPHVKLNLRREGTVGRVGALVERLVFGEIVRHDIDTSRVGSRRHKVDDFWVELLGLEPHPLKIAAPPRARPRPDRSGGGREFALRIVGLDAAHHVMDNRRVLVHGLRQRPRTCTVTNLEFVGVPEFLVVNIDPRGPEVFGKVHKVRVRVAALCRECAGPRDLGSVAGGRICPRPPRDHVFIPHWLRRRGTLSNVALGGDPARRFRGLREDGE
mmetsp:Transcript_20320/g.52696  ORF Transcript_20320/g.52696 Transcript_20320/m.52696 type:complete len:340 (+) Transcript_20320:1397-2416(+)